MADEDPFPVPPQFSVAEIEDFRKSGDYRPIFFEWYKYVGLVSNFIASIDLASPAARPVAPSHFGVLIGLLNRCSRLMLANLTLSNQGLFGETTAIVDRCIFESCVKVQWLCKQASEDFFERFIAEGLNTELALKSQIETNIASRGGAILPIEQRMLRSIECCLRTSSLNDGQIANLKKLPHLASMLDDLGNERLTYVVGQKIGSHHVHGTWPSLLLHYLE